MNNRERPNIIFILVDDLGWGDLGCYGNLLCETPHLNRMADDGLLLEQFYVNGPLCSPSRAAFLTGQFPARHGIHYWMTPEHNHRFGMPDALAVDAVMLPRLLQRGGYRTAHFGKWHVGEDPLAPVSFYGFDEVDYVWQGVGPNPGIAPNDPRGTQMLVDRAIRFAQGCVADDVSFFVHLCPRDVHSALRPSARSLARYAHLMSEGKYSTAMQIYYAAVTEMDRQIGRLLDWIDDSSDLAQNTLVIFTSDNGPEDIYVAHAGHHAVGLPGPFRGRKRSLYEGGIRMPFIARWRGQIPSRTLDRESVISAVDLLPTLCTFAGVQLPGDYAPDGEDVSQALLARVPHSRTKCLFWEWRFDTYGQCLNRSPMLAIREGRWKLLLNPDQSRIELYDIPRQPMELHSQADKHPDVVKALADKALKWQATLPAGPASASPGSDAYPGCRWSPGRGPHEGHGQGKGAIAPIRVQITREDYFHD